MSIARVKSFILLLPIALSLFRNFIGIEGLHYFACLPIFAYSLIAAKRSTRQIAKLTLAFIFFEIVIVFGQLGVAYGQVFFELPLKFFVLSLYSVSIFLLVDQKLALYLIDSLNRLLLFCSVVSLFSLAYSPGSSLRFKFDFFGIHSADPNFTAFILLVAIQGLRSIERSNYYFPGKEPPRFLSGMPARVSVFFLYTCFVLSFSRGMYLAAALLFICELLSSPSAALQIFLKAMTRIFTATTLFFLCLIFAAIAFTDQFSILYNAFDFNFVNRLSISELYRLGGRDELFSQVATSWFGSGTYAFRYLSGSGLALHNFYLELLYGNGIIGTLSFAILLYCCFCGTAHPKIVLSRFVPPISSCPLGCVLRYSNSVLALSVFAMFSLNTETSALPWLSLGLFLYSANKRLLE